MVLSTMSGRLSSREVNVSSPDDERNWTVWGLVLNPLVKTHCYVQGALLLPLNGNVSFSPFQLLSDALFLVDTRCNPLHALVVHILNWTPILLSQVLCK